MPAIPTMPAVPTPPTRNNPSTFDTLADAFLSWLPIFGAWLAAIANAINSLIGNLATATVGQSTTSLTLGAGAQSLTVQAGLAFGPGQTVKIASTASPTTQFMIGTVTSYNASTGALGVNVTAVTGAGTLAAWTVSLILYMGDGQGEVYFQYTSPTVVTLMPDIKGMGRLWINTVAYGWMTWLCPAGGLQLLVSAITGVAPNTTYYIYAYAGTSGLALEASATAWTWDTSSGLRIAVKTGDITRTLVGMVRINGSTQFEDSSKFRGVLSWFNPKKKTAYAQQTTALLASSGVALPTWMKLSTSELEIGMLTWGKIDVCSHLVQSMTTNGTSLVGISVDQATSTSTSWPALSKVISGTAELIGGALAETIDHAEGWVTLSVVGTAGAAGSDNGRTVSSASFGYTMLKANVEG